MCVVPNCGTTIGLWYPTNWVPQFGQVHPDPFFLSPEVSPLNGQPHPLRDRHWSCLNRKV